MSKRYKYGNINHNDLLRYVQGEMSDEDRHALEREIQKDLFASEALEGLSSVRIEEARADLDKIESQLTKRVSGRNSAVWIRIAASVAIILTIGTLYFTVFTDMINQTDRMAVETESTEGSRDQKADQTLQPPLESEDVFESEGQNQEKLPEPTVLEKKAEEPRTREMIVERQTSAAAVVPDQDEEIKSEINGIEKDVLAEDILGDASSGGEDSTILMEDDVIVGEIIAEQVENVVDPETEQEILREEFAMETPAAQSRVGSSRMATPPSTARALTIEQSASDAATTSAKKLAGSDQSPTNISAQILSDSISTNPVDGLDSFRQYLNENLVFPIEESPFAQASVVLNFTVDTSGRPDDIEVIETSGDPFSREAIRLLQEGPDWIPSREETSLQIRFNH